MIKTGKNIYDLLKNNPSINALVGDKIFPLVIPEGTILPCVVYSREFENTNTKDFLASSESFFTITILSEKYEEGINIQSAIYDVLKEYRSETVRGIILNSGNETYAEGQFIQNLIFKVKTL